MIKKITAFVLALIMFAMLPFSAMAETRKEKNDFVSGKTFSLISSDLVLSGEKTFEFTLPFYSDKVTIKTSTTGKTVYFTIDGVRNTINLDSESTEFKFTDVLRRGEKDLVISGNATITGIIFNEIKEDTAATILPIELSDYEEALKTALVLRVGSPYLKTKTAVRRYDYNNINVKPETVDTTVYVPADALALALEIYWEEDKANDFFVLRKEQTEIFRANGTTKKGENNVYSDYTLATKEIEGKTYVPAVQVAEAFGYYALSEEDFIIIDYRSRAKNIADNFYEELKAEFDLYMPAEEKGNTYYVSKNANASDNNDGSRENPWATIEKANKTAKAGDTVIIGEGIWRETIKPENDGTPSKPIIFKAEEGKDVCLSATKTVDNFTVSENGLLVADVPEALEEGRNQVFYNGKNLVEARYPNSDVGEDGLFEYSSGIRLSPEWLTEGDLMVSEPILKTELDNPTTESIARSKIVHSSTLLQEEEMDYWKGATFVNMNAYAWSMGMAKVDRSSKGMLNLTDISSDWRHGVKGRVNKGYLTGHIHCIDIPGEWAVKDNKLYIMPPNGETAQTLKVELKTKQLVADLSGRKNIQIDGFKTLGGGAKLMDSEMCVINNCDMQYISHYTYLYNNASLKDNTEDKKNDIIQRGEAGLYIGGENNAVVNTKVQYSAGGGIMLYGANSFVDNNALSDIDYMGSSTGSGITVGSEGWKESTDKFGGHTITHNTIKRTARASMTFASAFSSNTRNGSEYKGTNGSLMPLEVAYNDMSDDALASLDTGTVYSFGTNLGHDLSNSRLHNNFTYETYTKGTTVEAGIYWDAWTTGVDSFDNVQFAAQNGQFKYSEPLEQTKTEFTGRWVTVDSWNNKDLGVKKKDEITINDFPSSKPYQVGSSLLNDKHSLTYEYYKNNAAADGVYCVNDMEFVWYNSPKSGNKVKFSKDNQYFTIKNVDFSKYNKLTVTYSADYYNTDDDYIEICVGSKNSPVARETLRLYPEAKNADDLNCASVTFSSELLTGNKDVYIMPYDSKLGNSEILQVSMSSEKDVFSDYTYDYTDIQAGMFTNSGDADAKVLTWKPRAYNSLGRMYTTLYDGKWTYYKGVTVSEKKEALNISLSSGGTYSGSILRLRKDSRDGEIIASVTIPDTSWSKESLNVKLNSPIDPGTYNLYLTIPDGGNSKAATVYDFGFADYVDSDLRAEQEEKEIAEQTRNFEASKAVTLDKNAQSLGSMLVNAKTKEALSGNQVGDTLPQLKSAEDGIEYLEFTFPGQQYIVGKGNTAKELCTDQAETTVEMWFAVEEFFGNEDNNWKYNNNNLFFVSNGNRYFRPENWSTWWLKVKDGKLVHYYKKASVTEETNGELAVCSETDLKAYQEQFVHVAVTRSVNKKYRYITYKTYLNGEKIAEVVDTSGTDEIVFEKPDTRNTGTAAMNFFGWCPESSIVTNNGFVGRIADFGLYHDELTDSVAENIYKNSPNRLKLESMEASKLIKLDTTADSPSKMALNAKTGEGLDGTSGATMPQRHNAVNKNGQNFTYLEYAGTGTETVSETEIIDQPCTTVEFWVNMEDMKTENDNKQRLFFAQSKWQANWESETNLNGKHGTWSVYLNRGKLYQTYLPGDSETYVSNNVDFTPYKGTLAHIVSTRSVDKEAGTITYITYLNGKEVMNRVDTVTKNTTVLDRPDSRSYNSAGLNFMGAKGNNCEAFSGKLYGVNVYGKKMTEEIVALMYEAKKDFYVMSEDFAVSDVEFYNGDNNGKINQFASLSNCDTLKVRVNFVNCGKAVSGLNLCVAIYSKNKLEAVEYLPVTDVGTDKNYAEATIDKTKVTQDENTIAKVFVWDGNMKPVNMSSAVVAELPFLK